LLNGNKTLFEAPRFLGFETFFSAFNKGPRWLAAPALNALSGQLVAQLSKLALCRILTLPPSRPE
jgi:hypothetical protein